MVSADKGGGGMVYFTYDAAGERVRKVYEHSGLIEERIYLGGFEVYRKRVASTGELTLERETLHVMDGVRRIALVETKTVDTDIPAFTPTTVTRLQLGNHLGSASLEVDLTGLLISYEEYHPYGTTAYQSATSAVEVSRKRYRYTGKERDEETGLYYHGARYYAPWLGRWTAADPAGLVDGVGLYTYCDGRPTAFVDPSGAEKTSAEVAYEQYQWHSQMAVRLRASGADASFVATFEAQAASFKRVAIEGPEGSGKQAVPVLAAAIPGMGKTVKPNSGSGHPAVAAYRSLTGHSALHTQQTVGGAGAALAGLSTVAAVGMRYYPKATPIVAWLASKPIAKAMHFEDPGALRKVVMRAAETVNRVVAGVEKIVDLARHATPLNGANGEASHSPGDGAGLSKLSSSLDSSGKLSSEKWLNTWGEFGVVGRRGNVLRIAPDNWKHILEGHVDSTFNAASRSEKEVSTVFTGSPAKYAELLEEAAANRAVITQMTAAIRAGKPKADIAMTLRGQTMKLKVDVVSSTIESFHATGNIANTKLFVKR